MKNLFDYKQKFLSLSSATLILLAFASFTLSSAPASAQSGAGAIQGTVADATGAVVPGARIHVVGDATGVSTDAKSNNAGFYQVPDLITGTYTITVISPGMKTYKSSVELLVAQTAVINPVLVPGEVTTQVIVNADTIQLTTEDTGAIESTLENARINQLPEDGRDISTLMNLTTPGLENSGQNLNGLATEALAYVVDGAPTQNNLYGGLLGNVTQVNNTVDPDAVQEVRLENNGSGAQYATPGTAILATKSGTNALHGSLFETAKNNAIGVAKSRQDPPGFVAPKYIRNEFGVSLGGPIILPHLYHGKNKSFFFFAYERFSLAQGIAGNTAVPTVAMRGGDFSGLVNAKGVLQTIYDPATTASSAKCAASGGGANQFCRTAFPGNKIPITEESPAAAIYYQLVPLPSGPFAAANPLVTNNLNYVSTAYQLTPQFTFRLDHEFSENNRAYLRFSDINNPTNTNPTSAYNVALPGIPAGAALGYSNAPSQSFLAAAGYTHIFSSTFFAETILSQQWLNSTQIPGVAPGVNYEKMLNLPNNFGEPGFPGLGDATLITNLKSSQTNSAHISQIISTVDENFTKVLGRHQLLFGARFQHQRMADQPNGKADQITFGNKPTGIYQPSSAALYNSLVNTGYADASFFLGSAGSYAVNLEPPHVHYHRMELDGYIQDNFHLTRNLTLNLGLRYEAHPGLWTKDGIVNTFDLKNDAMVLGATPAQLIAKGYTTQAIITNDLNIGVKFETPQQAGFPDKLFNDYNLNFLPRVGFAWLPFTGRKTVIRGAFGMYDYPTPLEDYANHPEANNPFTNTYTQSYSTAAQAIDGLPNEGLRYNTPKQFGIIGLNTANAVNSNSINSILPGIALRSVVPNWKPEQVTEVNVTIEQPFKGNSALRVSWVFTHASNLYVGYDFNHAPSTFQYEMAYGVVPPTGGASVIGTPLQNTYSATATGPYDQTTWGNNELDEQAGWSNYNALQVNYQRLFHHGAAYQITGTYAKSMAVAGNNDTQILDPVANYPGVLGAVGVMTSPYGTVSPGLAPPARPSGSPVWADYKELDRYEAYQLDNTTPVLHFKGNGILDLPIGRGKKFLGHVNRFWDELVGGYQIAGTANIISQVFQPPSGNWGPTNPLTVYKHKIKTSDCRSGVCQSSYLWYNGYIAPTALPGAAACGSTAVVNGIPSTYVPFQTPINNTPPPCTGTATGAAAFYGDNDVVVTLTNGTQNTVAYDSGPQGSNPFSKVWLNGPINWTMDASIFKVFPITKQVNLRVNVDAFNALNIQGSNTPDAAGLQHFLNSYWAPRQIQLTARLSF